MAEVSWIKISTAMFEDEKIRLIESLPEGDTLINIWLQLLIMAGKTNDNGYIYLSEGVPYTPQMLAVVMNKQQTVMELAIKTFTDFRMIETDEKGILILNWEKHQNVDGLERIREQNRERKRRQRQRQKELPPPKEDNSDDVSRDMSRDEGGEVTPSHATDKEEDKEKERDKDKEKDKRLTPENLCSTDDIKTFVESQQASNPLSVSNDILVDYIDTLRLTRKTARISQNIIRKLWEKWMKAIPAVVSYAMLLHIQKHDDKPEEYTLGIIKNTPEHEANRKLIRLMNQGGDTHATGSKQDSGNSSSASEAGYYEQFDDLFAT